jgi:hypothetical protein
VSSLVSTLPASASLAAAGGVAGATANVPAAVLMPAAAESTVEARP